MKARRIVRYSKMGSELANQFANLALHGLEDMITEIFDPKSKRKEKAVIMETNECNYLVVLDNYNFASNMKADDEEFDFPKSDDEDFDLYS